MKRFSHIDTWVFDLDNTLYAANSVVFPRIHDRITQFIMKSLNQTKEEAIKTRNHYFKTYNTTLNGLMTEHNMAPEEYLEYIHDIKVSDTPKCNVISECIGRLPGRKLIYTNGSRKHAQNITSHLGIDHYFDDIFDITDANYLPKPNPKPYKKFIDKYDVNPRTSCMFEDMAMNLKPASDLGMTTLWLYSGAVDSENDGDHIDHRSESLADWFSDIF